jgi:small subunit ribosomal protein S1
VSVIFEHTELNAVQESFANLLEQSFNRKLIPGSVVKGEILKLERDYLAVDIGGKCEGHVTLKELLSQYKSLENIQHNLKAGDVRDFFIVKDFDDNNSFLLSIRRVDTVKDWDTLSEKLENGETLDVIVCATTKGGVLVQVLSLKGFIPASQLRIAKTLEDLVGQTIPVKLLEVNRDKNKLILSHRAAVFEAQSERRTTTLAALTEGLQVEGEVVKITNFGAFVDINGIDGLLPLSEISWRRLKHPSDELTLGQRLTVQVLTVDRQLERISLSMKRLSHDPWHSVADRVKEGDGVSGPVTKLLNSGFLVELEPGVEAFCSYNRVSRDNLIVGETMTFNVSSVLSNERRITLEPQS